MSSLLEKIGWWKPKPKLINPVQVHWQQFAIGDKVDYFGNQGVITEIDDYWDDDSENLIPEMSISYKDVNNKVHHDILFPHDVWCLVSRVEAEHGTA